jgi:hypothetical protein
MKNQQADLQLALFPPPPVRLTERQRLRTTMQELVSNPLAAVKKGDVTDAKCPSCDQPKAVVKTILGARMLVTCLNEPCKYTFRMETPTLK